MMVFKDLSPSRPSSNSRKGGVGSESDLFHTLMPCPDSENVTSSARLPLRNELLPADPADEVNIPAQRPGDIARAKAIGVGDIHIHAPVDIRADPGEANPATIG